MLGQLGDPATLNQYSYCLGDPVNYIDPTGQSAWSVAIGTAITSGVEAAGIGIATAAVSFVSVVVLGILYKPASVSSDDWNPNYNSDAPTTVDVGSGGGGGGSPQPPKKQKKQQMVIMYTRQH